MADWDREARVLVGTLIYDSVSPFETLDLHPELIPFYREVGNKHLIILINLLRIELSRSKWNQDADLIANLRAQVKRALQYGANPYSPDCVIAKASKIHKYTTDYDCRCEVVMYLITMLVELGVDIYHYDQDYKDVDEGLIYINMGNAAAVHFLLNQGIPWTKECTNRLAYWELGNDKILQILCHMGRIYSIPNLLYTISHSRETRNHRNYNNPSKTAIQILIECGVAIPHSWLEDKELKRFIKGIMTAYLSHKANGYFRACWLVENLPEVKPMREELVHYLLYFPFPPPPALVEDTVSQDIAEPDA